MFLLVSSRIPQTSYIATLLSAASSETLGRTPQPILYEIGTTTHKSFRVTVHAAKIVDSYLCRFCEHWVGVYDSDS